MSGKLFLVGLGPGDQQLQTPGALAVLENCDVVVGYRGYVDQIANLTAGKELRLKNWVMAFHAFNFHDNYIFY